MFCGYACVIYAMRGEYETAAPFIGIAIVLDMLDGRIARMTGTASEFGLQFDSLADVISFGMAPAILSFAWGLASLGRLGWAAAFLFVAAAALRLARFNIQAPSAATSGISSGCRARPPRRFRRPRSSPIRTGCTDIAPRCRARDGGRPGAADGEHDPVPQLQDDRIADPPACTRVLFLVAVFIALIVTHPELMLVTLAYGYLFSAFVGLAWTRLRRRPTEPSTIDR